MKNPFWLFLGLFLVLSGCSSDDPTATNSTEEVVQDDEEIQDDIMASAPQVSNISQIKADIMAEITVEGTSQIIAKGIVWSTDPMPTIDNDKVESGPGAGEVHAALDLLNVDTPYFVRAFAQTSNEVIYSEQVQFSTLPHVVFEGYFYATTQQQVDDFGAQGYTKITGSIELLGHNISDLSSLSSIMFIGGSKWWGLNVQETSVQDFSGLENLVEVRGPLVINDNSNLSSLQGLNKLKYVGMGFLVWDNNLTSFEGLENLETIGVDGDGDIFSEFYISEDGVTNFQGMNNLTTIDVPILIDSAQSLVDFSGLENVVNFSNRFKITNNIALKNFNGLSGITTCDDFWIAGNSALENFQGLNNLSLIESVIVVSGNFSLTNFEGMDSLDRAESWVVIENNPFLLNFEGLNNLNVIKNSFSITNNYSLTSLYGLDNLEKVGTFNPQLSDKFDILDNSSLEDYCSLQQLFNTGVVSADVSISGNAYNPTVEQIELGNCSL